MRVLVTGGNGRLGPWVARELRDHGHAVVCVDRQPPREREAGIRYRTIELSDLGQVAGALAGCEAVVHLGAIPAPWSFPDEVVFLNNVGATYNTLQAAHLLGIRKAIIASSCSAYGMAWTETRFEPLYAPIDEDHPLLAHDPYALSKEVDERTAEMFVRRSRMAILAYRFHWIALPGEAAQRANDPNDDPARAATDLWGWVDIRDAARACRLGLEADIPGFEAVNIAAADTARHEPTADLIRTYCPTTELREPLPGNATGWSIAKARKLLGYVPAHSWRDEAPAN
jgi:nucleoside-diphosphate-sugar epimerase